MGGWVDSYLSALNEKPIPITELQLYQYAFQCSSAGGSSKQLGSANSSERCPSPGSRDHPASAAAGASKTARLTPKDEKLIPIIDAALEKWWGM